MTAASNILYVRRANERGSVNLGWLESNHSFSFGHYYDPKYMGVSVLRVINDDWVKPGAGFDTHGHRDMEIITYMLEGALKHKDSMGNEFTVCAGEVQRMSAGSGITHSEFNASDSEPVHLLQIWIQPKARGIAPGYQQARIRQSGALTPLVTPDGVDGSVTMHQDASLSRLVLGAGESIQLSSRGGPAYLHLISGELQAGGLHLTDGDAVAIAADTVLTATADSQTQALWFELPATH